MARNYKNPSIVSGLTLNDIINMDITTFNNLSLSDLRKVTGRLVSAGNKRLRNFRKNKESSPATRYIERSGGDFSTKGKDIGGLRAEYTRIRNFLTSDTSTLKGWRKVRKETRRGLEKAGITVSKENWDKMWKAYEELKEKSPEVANRALKYAVLKDIADMADNDDLTEEQIVQDLEKKISKIYEDYMEMNKDVDISDFFEIQ